jgi:hypothetical protein
VSAYIKECSSGRISAKFGIGGGCHENLSKIPNSVIILEKYLSLNVRTHVLLLAVREINWPKESNFVYLYAVTCSSTIHTESTVGFPSQWLRESATMLHL